MRRIFFFLFCCVPSLVFADRLGGLKADAQVLLSSQVTTNLSSGNTNYIQNTPTLQSGSTAYPDFVYVGSSQTIDGQLSVTNDVSGSTVVIVTGASSQSGALQQWRSSGGTMLSQFDEEGRATIGINTGDTIAARLKIRGFFSTIEMGAIAGANLSVTTSNGTTGIQFGVPVTTTIDHKFASTASALHNPIQLSQGGSALEGGIGMYGITGGGLNTNRNVGNIRSVWRDGTDATRDGKLTLSVYHVTTEHDGLNIYATTSSAHVETVGELTAISSATFKQTVSVSSYVVRGIAGYAPTGDGEIGYDSTKDAYVSGGGTGGQTGYFPRVMSSTQSFTDVLFSTNITTTETAFTKTYIIPANFFITNKALRITAIVEATTSGAPATVRMKLRVQKSGPTNVDLYDSGVRTPAANITSLSNMAQFLIMGTGSPSATGTLITGAIGSSRDNNQMPPYPFQNQINQPVSVDTTAAQTLQITVTYGSSVSGNSVELLAFTVEELS